MLAMPGPRAYSARVSSTVVRMSPRTRSSNSISFLSGCAERHLYEPEQHGDGRGDGDSDQQYGERNTHDDGCQIDDVHQHTAPPPGGGASDLHAGIGPAIVPSRARSDAAGRQMALENRFSDGRHLADPSGSAPFVWTRLSGRESVRQSLW